MKIKAVHAIVLGLSGLLMLSVSHAKCYPGLDCPEDLPKTKETPIPPKSSTDQWTTIERYKVNGGVVEDPGTGLMWMRCSLGQLWDGLTCRGETMFYSWDQAMNIPKHFEFASYSDWRVPNREELKTLMYCSSAKTKTDGYGVISCDGNYTSPTIVQAAFPQTEPSWFWTSSLAPGNNSFAWIIYFNDGDDGTDSKESSYSVRLVRGGR